MYFIVQSHFLWNSLWIKVLKKYQLKICEEKETPWQNIVQQQPKIWSFQNATIRSTSQEKPLTVVSREVILSGDIVSLLWINLREIKIDILEVKINRQLLNIRQNKE